MNSELVEHEIRIGDIVYYLDKWKWFVIGLTILAGVGATYFALRYTEQTFHADALMVLTAKNSSGLYNNNEMEPGNTDFLYAQNLVDSVVALVNSDKVVKALVEQVGLDINPQLLKGKILVSSIKNTAVLKVKVYWSDPAVSILLSNALMEVLPQILLDTLEVGNVNVIDYANTASTDYVTQIAQKVGIGLLAGLVLGCLLAILLGMGFRKIRNANDIEQDLQLFVLGELPHFKKNRKKAVTLLEDQIVSAAYVEACYRMIAAFQYKAKEQNMQTIAIVSALPNEGKTLTACNMAIALAHMRKKVLLIDLDIHKSDINRMFYLSNRKISGLYEIINKGLTAKDVVISLDCGVDVICAENSKGREISIDDVDIKKIIAPVMNDYHYIIIDTPPAGVLADALKIVKDLDGIVLIAKQECASIKVMQDTITLLEKAGGNIVGSILNDIRKRYIGSGYGYKLKYYAKQHYYYENQS